MWITGRGGCQKNYGLCTYYLNLGGFTMALIRSYALDPSSPFLFGMIYLLEVPIFCSTVLIYINVVGLILW